MKKAFIAVPVFFWILCIFAFPANAARIAVHVNSETANCGNIADDNYRTTTWFDAGTEITISAEETIDSIYIKWESIPKPWTLITGNVSFSAGEHGFLHEYVKVAKGTKSVTIRIPEGGAEIADVYAFSAGKLPDFVQIWEPSYDEADLLVFTAHSDDEILYMGPAVVNLTHNNTGRVQVAYMSDQYLTEPYRNHELLDGLWEMGVTHYPQLGEFKDLYSMSLELAMEQNSFEDLKEYVVRTIRRFKPQIVVTHDLEGEYGHGMHRMIAKAVVDTIDITDDASEYPESAQKYGTWDVPKTYLHLYEENQIVLPTREPLSDFGGRTVFDVCEDAFAKHLSQQGEELWVEDGRGEKRPPSQYTSNCIEFGLYRTTVGTDTGNSMLEHLVTYDEQERQAAEPETETGSEPATQEKDQNRKGGSGDYFWIIAGVLAALIVIGVIILVLRARAVKERQRRQQNRSGGRQKK